MVPDPNDLVKVAAQLSGLEWTVVKPPTRVEDGLVVYEMPWETSVPLPPRLRAKLKADAIPRGLVVDGTCTPSRA